MNELFSPSLSRTLVLVGMTGIGKTTVGLRLAERYGVPFFDSDQEIQKKIGMTGRECLETQGEPAFREAERDVILELLQGQLHVLAAAAGAFSNGTTRQAILERAVSVWLKASLELNFERVMQRKPTPFMLQGDNPKQRFIDLYRSREPFYKQADITIENANSVDETVESIVNVVHQLSLRRNEPGSKPLFPSPCGRG